MESGLPGVRLWQLWFAILFSTSYSIENKLHSSRSAARIRSMARSNTPVIIVILTHHNCHQMVCEWMIFFLWFDHFYPILMTWILYKICYSTGFSSHIITLLSYHDFGFNLKQWHSDIRSLYPQIYFGPRNIVHQLRNVVNLSHIERGHTSWK